MLHAHENRAPPGVTQRQRERGGRLPLPGIAAVLPDAGGQSRQCNAQRLAVRLAQQILPVRTEQAALAVPHGLKTHCRAAQRHRRDAVKHPRARRGAQHVAQAALCRWFSPHAAVPAQIGSAAVVRAQFLTRVGIGRAGCKLLRGRLRLGLGGAKQGNQ